MSNHPGHQDDALVAWSMPGPDARDLAQVLSLLEDFLRQASTEVLTELAGYPPARPLDPARWADWLADYLATQVLALQALTPTTQPTSSGDPT